MSRATNRHLKLIVELAATRNRLDTETKRVAELEARIAKASALLERTGDPGYVLEVDDVLAALALPRTKPPKLARGKRRQG